MLRCCANSLMAITLASSLLPVAVCQEPMPDKTTEAKPEIHAYASHIEAARQALEAGNSKGAKKTLALTNPKLRGWEHDYLLGKSMQNDPKSRKSKLTWDEDRSSVWSLAFTRDDRLLAASHGSIAKVWDFSKGKSIDLVGHNAGVLCVAVSPDGKKFATGGWDGYVFIWDAATGKKLLEYQGHNPGNKRPGDSETLHVQSVSFSPDGKQIASAAYPNSPFVNHISPEVKIWSTETGKTLKILEGQHQQQRSFAILCVTYSPDGTLIASGEFATNNQLPGGKRGAAVRLWDVKTGKELRALTGHTSHVLGVAFSPDGKRIASASTDRTLAVWDVATGKEVLRLRGHTLPVFSVMFSPDGKRLVSGCYDKTVKLWDVNSGTELLTFGELPGPIRTVAFSPDGKRIAAGGNAPGRSVDATIWDATLPRQ